MEIKEMIRAAEAEGLLEDTGKKLKVYIAGKITGDKNYWIKFRAVECEIVKAGAIALNPANLPEGMAGGDYMPICMAMIDQADAVFFLPDWKESAGATLEHDYCRYAGKRVEYLK